MLVTAGEIYRMNLTDGAYTKTATIPVSFGILGRNTVPTTGELRNSSVAANAAQPGTYMYATHFGRSGGIATINPYPPESARTNTLPFASISGGNSMTGGQSIAYDSNGYVYDVRRSFGSYAAGIYKYHPASASTVALPSWTVFDNSGNGQISEWAKAISLSPDESTAYVLDYGNLRVARYATASGAFLGDFAISTTVDSYAMAAGPDGRIYLANGNGGGTIHDPVSGTLLGSFQASVAYPNADTVTAMTFSGNSLVLADETGLHVFTDSLYAPEPSSGWLLFSGVLGCLLTRKAIRNRSSGS